VPLVSVISSGHAYLCYKKPFTLGILNMHARCQNFEIIKGKEETFHSKTFFYPEEYQNFEVSFTPKPFFTLKGT
jgi:hypothetical protein